MAVRVRTRYRSFEIIKMPSGQGPNVCGSLSMSSHQGEGLLLAVRQISIFQEISRDGVAATARARYRLFPM